MSFGLCWSNFRDADKFWSCCFWIFGICHASLTDMKVCLLEVELSRDPKKIGNEAEADHEGFA